MAERALSALERERRWKIIAETLDEVLVQLILAVVFIINFSERYSEKLPASTLLINIYYARSTPEITIEY